MTACDLASMAWFLMLLVMFLLMKIGAFFLTSGCITVLAALCFVSLSVCVYVSASMKSLAS